METIGENTLGDDSKLILYCGCPFLENTNSSSINKLYCYFIGLFVRPPLSFVFGICGFIA